MNGRNNELNGAAIGIGLVLFLFYIIALAVACVLAFITVFLTCVAVAAWVNDGVMLDGQYISKDEGRAFILRGLVGAVLIPILLAIVFGMMGEPLDVPFKWLALGGFVFASTGIELIEHFEQAEKDQAAQQVILPPLPDAEYYAPPPMPPMQPREPFGYASWDDEELNR